MRGKLLQRGWRFKVNNVAKWEVIQNLYSLQDDLHIYLYLQPKYHQAVYVSSQTIRNRTQRNFPAPAANQVSH